MEKQAFSRIAEGKNGDNNMGMGNGEAQIRTQTIRFRSVAALCGCLMWMSGCGGSGSTPAPSPGDGGTAASNSEAQQPATTPANNNTSVSTTADGQKMLGDIPYDVWFDDPVAISNSNAPVGTGAAPPAMANNSQPTETSAQPVVGETPDTTTTPDTAANTVASGGGDDSWDSLISAEVLSAEVKSIRNFLNQKLQTVGQYNSSMFEIPAQTATLATLAAIAKSHPGDISWKERADHIRTVAASMHEETLQTGPKFQRPMLAKFELVDEMLSGSLPGGIDDPSAEFDFAEIAEMPQLMKRMDLAFNRMTTDASSEDGFKSEAEMVQHESAILGTMMKALLTEGYGYADDEDFLKLARPIQDAATSIRDAVDTDDFGKYDASLSSIRAACTKCHNAYKE